MESIVSFDHDVDIQPSMPVIVIFFIRKPFESCDASNRSNHVLSLAISFRMTSSSLALSAQMSKGFLKSSVSPSSDGSTLAFTLVGPLVLVNSEAGHQDGADTRARQTMTDKWVRDRGTRALDEKVRV